MPGKRGRVYCCDVGKCEWKGERFQAGDHYFKNHSSLDKDLFVCLPCNEPFGTVTTFQRHNGQKRHKQRMDTANLSEDEALLSRPDVEDPLDHFSVLSQTKSDAVWESRIHQTGT